MRFSIAQLLTFILLATAGFHLSSCSEEQLERLEVTPLAYGSVDQVYLVCDKYFWETSEVGDTLRAHLEALYPVLPQPEPILDIRHISSKDFKGVLKTHRAIIIMADLSDKEDPTTKLVRQTLGSAKVNKAMKDDRYRMAIHRDRWAKDQTVIYWFAPDRQSLFETVARDYKKVLNIFQKVDSEKLLEQVYFSGEDKEIKEIIKDNYQVELRIPKGFDIAHRDSAAMWLRRETNKTSVNIFVHTLNDPQPNMLSIDSMKVVRNRLTKDYFASEIENSYMQIDDENLPVFFQEISFGEQSAAQIRGLWYIENDFMGGPFVTYFIPDSEHNRIIVLDGFVYAPGLKKRAKMRELDAVFSTLKLNADSSEKISEDE